MLPHLTVLARLEFPFPSTQELELKAVMAAQHKKGSTASTFNSLLPSSKQRRLEAYKMIPKVQFWLQKGQEVVAWLLACLTSRGRGPGSNL